MDVSMESIGRNSHEEKFRVYHEALLHAASCQEKNCSMNDGRCHKVKASIDHFVRCYGPRRKVSPIEQCESCSKIWGLLCYHAKICQVTLGQHCIVSQCDYLREKILRKQEKDSAELRHAQETIAAKREEWPVERRIAQVEQDRLQVLQLIAVLREQKAQQQMMMQS